MRKEAYKLQKTQKILWHFITAPEGVEKALSENPGVDLPISGDARLTSAERLDVYANMYFYRILDSLKEDFSAILKTIGNARFHNLVTDYLIKHPSTYWSLRDVGKVLPEFLKNHALSKTWPFLSELAQFEWSLLDIFDAANTPVLTREQLSNIKASAWAGLRLRVVPALRILKSKWPVDRIRQNRTRHRLTSRTKIAHVLVWRRDLKVYYRLADPLEALLLKKMRHGCRFAEICSLAAEYSNSDQALTGMRNLLDRWLKEGLLMTL